MHKIDSGVFTSADFHFNDSVVNGTGQPLWRTSDAQQVIEVEGEIIKWTGNSAGVWGTPYIVGAAFLGNIAVERKYNPNATGPRDVRFKSVEFKTKPNEILDIEELQFDSIIMIPAMGPYNMFGWYDLPEVAPYLPGTSLCKGRPCLWQIHQATITEEDEEDEDGNL